MGFYMKNDLVVMDNNLIRASYKLTANEMRLVLCALAQIPKDAEVDPGKAYYITKRLCKTRSRAEKCCTRN